MAVVSGTVHSVDTIQSERIGPYQIARVLFTISPSQTYAQADNGQLVGVAAAIEDSRRNGRTVSLKTVMLAWPARKLSNPARHMALKTLAISTNDVTFEVTESATDAVDYTTELANGLVPEQADTFAILVGFEESGV